MDAPDPNRPDAPLVIEFLRIHEASCPGCGFELKSIAQARCPECGVSLCIDIVRADRRPTAMVSATMVLVWTAAVGLVWFAGYTWWCWQSWQSLQQMLHGMSPSYTPSTGFWWYCVEITDLSTAIELGWSAAIFLIPMTIVPLYRRSIGRPDEARWARRTRLAAVAILWTTVAIVATTFLV